MTFPQKLNVQNDMVYLPLKIKSIKNAVNKGYADIFIIVS